MNTTEQYRFTNGHLYEYDADSNAYMHVFHCATVRSEAEAIYEYEQMLWLENEL